MKEHPRDRSWAVGEQVRFVAPYRLTAPRDYVAAPELPAGTVGVVVRCFDDSLWVQVPGVADPITVWFGHRFAEGGAKTDALERLDDEL